MPTKPELATALRTIMTTSPQAYTRVNGSEKYPQIEGDVFFYPAWNGTLILADIGGLPYENGSCKSRIFGFHVHEGEKCLGDASDPFADAGLHYNPENCPHPMHAGDLPPLFGNHGYALQLVYTDRFMPEEIIGKTLIIHDMPDDFRTQPAGDSGWKIACGEIKNNLEGMPG